MELKQFVEYIGKESPWTPDKISSLMNIKLSVKSSDEDGEVLVATINQEETQFKHLKEVVIDFDSEDKTYDPVLMYLDMNYGAPITKEDVKRNFPDLYGSVLTLQMNVSPYMYFHSKHPWGAVWFGFKPLPKGKLQLAVIKFTYTAPKKLIIENKT
jgi:hypothetical protein